MSKALMSVCMGKVAKFDLKPGPLKISMSALHPSPIVPLPHLVVPLVPLPRSLKIWVLTGPPLGCVVLGKAGHQFSCL